MVFLPHVVAARHERAYRIHLTFNDGTEAAVDFAAWLSGPVFEPLKRPAYFSKVFIDGGAVAWPNGADVAPETPYEAALATRSNSALDTTAAGARLSARALGKTGRMGAPLGKWTT